MPKIQKTFKWDILGNLQGAKKSPVNTYLVCKKDSENGEKEKLLLNEKEEATKVALGQALPNFLPKSIPPLNS